MDYLAGNLTYEPLKILALAVTDVDDWSGDRAMCRAVGVGNGGQAMFAQLRFQRTANPYRVVELFELDGLNAPRGEEAVSPVFGPPAGFCAADATADVVAQP